jgi:two-component system chemotaxis sensor kinase CheA
MSAIVVGVGKQRFAIPRQSIEEIVTERGDSIRIDTIGGTSVATVRDRRIPLVDLGRLLGVGHSPLGEAQMLAIVSVSEGSYALAVDTVLDNEELVIKPASPAVMSTGLYAGQTLPDSGLPMLMLDCAGLASAAGLIFNRDNSHRYDEEAAVVETPGTPALLFLDLDGVQRAVPLGIVDRVEQIDTGMVRFTAGRMRLSIDGRILPLAVTGKLDGRKRLSVLRLKDGESEVAYAIDEALDIVALPEELSPSPVPGPVAGVVLLGEEQVELLDAFWVFGEYSDADAETGEAAPLCLLAADDGWMNSFVRPLLEAAGYRVATELAHGEAAAVVLTVDDSGQTMGVQAPVVRLRRRKAAAGASDDSIYRYDRAGLLSALEARVAGGR